MTVTLVWRTTGPAPADLAAFLHGSGGTGDLQADASVGDEPPDAWPRGRLVTSRHRLAIPADHPVGPIDLKAGLYSRADLGRLPALNAGGRRLDEDQVTLIRLDVAARD
jgi:hypothetical protein